VLLHWVCMLRPASLFGNLSLVGASSLLQLESQQCILTQNTPMLILSLHSTVVSSTKFARRWKVCQMVCKSSLLLC
jgi:hypothetical protein